jgi:hypothetical protein
LEEIFFEKEYPPMKENQERTLNNICINKADFQSLGPNQELTDSVVYAFLKSRADIANKHKNNVFIFDPQITDQIFRGKLYTAFALKYGVLQHSIWLWPMCINNHWVMFVVILPKRNILCLDSLKSHAIYGKQVIPSILNFVKHCHKLMKIEIDIKNWDCTFPVDIPHQGATLDCGVHLCVWAHIICTELCTTFDANNMPSARKYINKVLLTVNLNEEKDNILTDTLLSDGIEIYMDKPNYSSMNDVKCDIPTAHLCHNLLQYCNNPPSKNICSLVSLHCNKNV